MKIGGDVNDVLELLNNTRRRKALYCLLSNEYTDLDSLALQIAAWEENETIASVDEDASERVKITLHHNHIPKLIDKGIVEYDDRSRDIVRRDRFDQIESIVRHLRNNEDATNQNASGDPSTDDGELDESPGPNSSAFQY